MIGHKILMALTGIALIAFLIAHLVGNLAIFSGQDSVNTYAAFLKSMPKVLWTLRIGLILVFVTHIWTSVRLTLHNRCARPVSYTYNQSVRASVASRTMMLSGLVVLSFVLFHLAHLTWGLVSPEQFSLVDEQGRHDVYMMTVLGFQNTYLAAFYIIAQILLAMHISHGFASAARTFGFKMIRSVGQVFAVVTATLYISIPLSIWSGLI